MLKVLFHGSHYKITKPIYGGGKSNNDYGKAFYCTETREMANEWAVSGNKDGFVNYYLIDTKGLKILSLNSKNYSILHWLAILLENRTFYISSPLIATAKEYILENFSLSYHDFDIIVGYRADDSYFSFAQDFLSGTISLEKLQRAMKLGRLGEQFTIKSKRAFNCIQFQGYEFVQASLWFKKREERDYLARKEYLDIKKTPFNPNELYITDLLRERIKPDDPRIQ